MVNNMKNRKRKYWQIVIEETCQRMWHEKIMITILLLSIIYTSISIYISNYCPIECEPYIANVGNTINEVVKNVCFSIIAGVIFYLINDVYKNVFKAVKGYDEMIHRLMLMHNLVSFFIQNLIGDKYDKTAIREDLYIFIMSSICGKDYEYSFCGSLCTTRQISIDNLIFLVEKRKDFDNERIIFLDTYRDLLKRDEVYNLNRFGEGLYNDITRNIEILVSRTNDTIIEIVDYDISTIVRWIVNYKITLASLLKKYMKYSYTHGYSDSPYCEEDIL